MVNAIAVSVRVSPFNSVDRHQNRVGYRSIEHGGWDLKSMILVKPSKNFPSVPSIKLWSQSAMLNKVNEIRPFKRSSMDGLAYYGIRMIR